MNNWRYGDCFNTWYNLDHISYINIQGNRGDEICYVKAFGIEDGEWNLFYGSYDECQDWRYKFVRGE